MPQLVLVPVLLSVLYFGRTTSELSNALPVDTSGQEGEACDLLQQHVRSADLSTESTYPPQLIGKWVSEGCEVRSGPEYIIRSYSFSRNNTFRLLQFHYADASCTSPQWAVVARGKVRVRGRSWITPGATEADYYLHRVTVQAHRPHAAADIARKVNATCPGFVRRRWRTFRDYVILNLAPDDHATPELASWEHLRAGNVANMAEAISRQHRSSNSHGADEEIDCADGVLPASFHELQLLRVQHRPASAPDSREPRLELLTGDIHSRPEMRLTYRPTAYQPPLLRIDQSPECILCREIARASERSPPHLPAKPRLPVFLSGEWISPRCEIRPLGMFIKRQLKFLQQRGRKWAGEFHYFSDPLCSITTMSIHASGRFSTGRESASVQGGTELEFRVDTAALVLHDSDIINALNAVPVRNGGKCGSKNHWELNELQDITATGGCDALGINVPIIERELFKIEIDTTGNSLLFIGQVDTERGYAENGEIMRPTAYQMPLIQCRSTDDMSVLHHVHRSNMPLAAVITSNHLFPIPHARIALSNAICNLIGWMIMFSLVISVRLM